MKSRIPKQSEKAFMLNIPENIEKILTSNSVECIKINENDLSKSISELIEKTSSDTDGDNIYDGKTKFILLSGLSGARLNRILTRILEADKEILKAVVTQSNKNWTFLKLLEEVKEEDLKMKSGRP